MSPVCMWGHCAISERVNKRDLEAPCAPPKSEAAMKRLYFGGLHIWTVPSSWISMLPWKLYLRVPQRGTLKDLQKDMVRVVMGKIHLPLEACSNSFCTLPYTFCHFYSPQNHLVRGRAVRPNPEPCPTHREQTVTESQNHRITEW